MCHAGTKSTRPSIASFIRAPVGTASDRAASSLLSRIQKKKQERWEEAVNSIDFSHSSHKAWRTINKLLAGLDAPPRKWSNFRLFSPTSSGPRPKLLDGSISLKFLLDIRLKSESFDSLDDLLGFGFNSYDLKTTKLVINPLTGSLVILFILNYNF